MLSRLWQEDSKFEASLGNLVKPCLKIETKKPGDIAQVKTLGSTPSTSKEKK